MARVPTSQAKQSTRQYINLGLQIKQLSRQLKNRNLTRQQRIILEQKRQQALTQRKQIDQSGVMGQTQITKGIAQARSQGFLYGSKGRTGQYLKQQSKTSPKIQRNLRKAQALNTQLERMKRGSPQFFKTVKEINRLGYQPIVSKEGAVKRAVKLSTLQSEKFLKTTKRQEEFKFKEASRLQQQLIKVPAESNAAKSLIKKINRLGYNPIVFKEGLQGRQDIINKISQTNISNLLKRKPLSKAQEKMSLEIKKASVIEPRQKFQTTSVLTVEDSGKGLDKLQKKLKLLKEKTLVKITRSKPEAVGERVFKGVVVLGALGAVRGLTGLAETITNPKQTAQNLVQAAKQPVQTIKAIGQEFIIDPVGTIAEFYVYNKALGIAGRGVKNSGVGKYVSRELFIRSQPKQVQPAIRKILKATRAQEKLSPKAPNLKKVDFLEVKALSKTEAKALTKTLEQTDSVVFGSVASRTLSGKKTPIPKDVDLATRSVSKFNTKFINNLPKGIRKNYIVKAEKIIRASDKTPILDVKPFSRLIQRRNLITRKGVLPVTGYSNVPMLKKVKGSILPQLKKGLVTKDIGLRTQKIVKVGKVRLTGFGEQTTRKGLGTLQVLLEKNVKRAKDPQSLLISLEIQLKSLKATKPKTAIGKLKIKNKIAKIEPAVKLLKSKEFAKLLESKVKGITKEYPLVSKINVPKLKKIKVGLNKARQKLIKKISRPKLPAKVTPKKIQKPIKITVSQLSKLPASKLSRLPVSKLSKLPASKIPVSSLPPSKLSKLPKSIISKLPASKLSKLPSSILSKLPPSILSKLPASKIPPSSLTPSLLSKLPKSTLSKIPISSVSKLPISTLKSLIPKLRPKIPPIIKKKLLLKNKKLTKKQKKKIDEYLEKQPPIYRPSLAAILFNITSYKPPKSITGLEIRPIIIKRKV